MLDYLLDAMNEISDEHIVEAVNYEPKAKKLNLKKLIPLAACFVFVVVAVIAGSGLFEVAQPTTEPTIIGTPTYTYAPTQAPVQDSTTVVPTQCPTLPDWEDLNYGERYPEIIIQDVKYKSFYETISADRIGEHILSETVTRYYTTGELYSATAEIYEIKDLSPEAFVAIKFTEDEKGEYFLYNKPDYKPETLGDFLDAIDANNTLNFIGDVVWYTDTVRHYYGELWSDDRIEIDYSIDARGHKELFGLLWKNRDAKCCDGDFNNSNSERIAVSYIFMGRPAYIYLRESGYPDTKTFLYVDYPDVNGALLCFELDSNALSDYIAFLEAEAQVIDAVRRNKGTTVPLFPELTSTTTPTTEGTTLPPTNENFHEVEKVFGTAKTLGDIIDGFDIEKADYGISGDMTVDLFAHLEENGKDDITYSIAADTTQQLVDFMQKHSASKAEERRCRADVRLIFSAYFMGNSGRISLCNDGYLYISCGAINKAFYVGEDAYHTFKENLIAVVWTTENPVTFG